MTQIQFLEHLVTCLEELKIPYVVVGSVASSVHGDPRSTKDFDIVIQVSAADLEALIARLQSTCYVSPEAAKEALLHRSMFNVMDLEDWWKADLIIHDFTPFEASKLQRGVQLAFSGVSLRCLTPEDSILSKLKWAKMGSSEYQMRDALNVARVQWDKLDLEYLAWWARELGVEHRLRDVLEQAKLQQPPDGFVIP
jgi:hypothetical protein